MMQMVTTLGGGARVDVEFGPFRVRTDQPPHAGGEASAPTPFATFLASIGACAGIYALSFCRTRGLPVEGLQIVQTMDTDRVTGMVRAIHLDIHLPPGFPEKYRDALIRAVEQCTIKKHLEVPPRFEITTRAAVRAAG
jgi:ribosomal protein S12 methylthiotransferase accessory factor